MLEKPYYYLDEAAQILSTKTGLVITQDDLISKAIENKLFLHISAFQWLVTFEGKSPFRFDGLCGIESGDLKSALQTFRKRMPFYVSNIPVKTSELAIFGIQSNLDFSCLLPAEPCSCPLDFADLVITHDALLDFIKFHCPEIEEKNLNTDNSSPTENPLAVNLFRRNPTGTWDMQFQGVSYLPLTERKGFLFIQQLLQNPNQRISSIELNALFAESESVNLYDSEEVYLGENLSITEYSDAGEVFDKKALKQYQERVTELQDLVQESLDTGSHDEAEKYEAELEVLLSEITKGTVNKKRIRKDKSSQRKISDSVCQNIKNALKVIDKQCPELAEYLKKNIKTGTECVYTDTSVCWFFE